MRVLALSMLTLFATGWTALAAAPAAKQKAGNPPPRTKAAARTAPAAEAGDAERDDQPAKKAAKKGPGLKVTAAGETELLKTLSYMQGYGFGKQLAQQFGDQGVELDMDVLLGAFNDALEGKEPTMSEEELKEVFPEIQKLVTEKQAAKHEAEGEAFLAANKKKEGVKTLPSGLQYKILKSGRGETPKKTDTVKAHYKGTLLNGMEFDSSYKRGEPTSFPVGQVIKGWTEALQLMKVGDKWQLFIPGELAYGSQGNRGIPPNATLLFEVELLGIEKGGKAGPSFK